MTALAVPRPDAAATGAAPLLPALLEALLREDALGLRSRAVVVERPDGAWLRLPTPDGAGLLVPVVRGALLADWGVRDRAVLRADTLAPLTTAAEVLGRLTPEADPEAAAGLVAVQQEHADAADAEAALPPGPAPSGLDRGLPGALALDALAARRRHPLYPTSAARTGMSVRDLRRYAPEHAPRFPLHWVALPLDALARSGTFPRCLPRCSDVGLDPGYDTTHLALPVHPGTAGGPLLDAVDRAGLAAQAVLAPRTLLDVVPTLSLRTVALAEQPDLHVKLPLAVSTLGRLNRRALTLSSLADGAAVQQLLDELVAGDPGLRGRLLHADESTWAHAGSDLLAVLVRRWPAGLERSRVVPVAALPARLADGRTAAQHLADEHCGGDLRALLESYLALLVDVHVRLWLVHGVALEAHQQNTAVVLDGAGDALRLRLLLKDDDGPRLDRGLLAQSRGGAPEPLLHDPRTWARDPRELCDVVTTITLHLCAAAVVLGVTQGDDATRGHLLTVLRRELEQAAERYADRRDVGLLRSRVLAAERLPVKGMLTAGTLLPKSRTAARDVNKHYAGTGPSYLPRRA